MNQTMIEAKAIIESVKRFVPDETIFDIEYCKNIYTAVKNLEKEKLMVLRDLVKHFLHVMEEKEASDIDLGGLGTNGRVWFRVQGQKTQEESLGEFNLEEFDILLLSLLEDKQAELFFLNRNFDFSFILAGSQGVPRRLRATMYLDMGHVALNMRMIDATIRPLHGYAFHPNILVLF